MSHPCTEMTDLHGDVVEIDDDIVPLIHACWDLEIETINSCQDNGGFVWLNIAPFCLDEFLEAISLHTDNGDLIQRMSEISNLPDVWDTSGGLDLVNPNRWWVSLCTFPDERDDGKLLFYTSISVRFPPSDLAEVVLALETAALARVEK
jgi:hypothetical protein